MIFIEALLATILMLILYPIYLLTYPLWWKQRKAWRAEEEQCAAIAADPTDIRSPLYLARN